MDIESRDNRHVKEWRRLASDARYRRKNGCFALEGARLCADAALSDVELPVVMVTKRAREQYATMLIPLFAKARAVYTITDALASYMGDTATPQGVFAVGVRRDAAWQVSPRGRYLALEDVQDPQNLGTMIRTAEAMGVDGLLLSADCCDVYNPKVLRGSMGGVFRLPFAVTEHLPTSIAQWQELGLTVYACVVDREAEPLTGITFTDGDVCLIGNEGNGLTPETVSVCKRRITIPMSGRAESLNASMAAGIVLWELTRARED